MYNSKLKYPKWQLSTGKFVEDTMQAFAKECLYEHFSLSLILDISDPCWKSYFTPAEMVELRTYHKPELKPLPKEVKEYLDKFSGVYDLNKLIDIHMQNRFHPSQADLHWVEKTIGDILDLYYYSYDVDNKTEADLLETNNEPLEIEKWVGNAWWLDAPERRIMYRCKAQSVVVSSTATSSSSSQQQQQQQQQLDAPQKLVEAIADAQKELKQKQPHLLSDAPLVSSTIQSWTAAVRLPDGRLVVGSHHGVTLYPSRERIIEIDCFKLAIFATNHHHDSGPFLVVTSHRRQVLLLYKLDGNNNRMMRDQQPCMIENVLGGFHVID
ncbi:hypothetical protein BDB00DRAFT_791600 [Zychaea mexicana]|uniref:uncharacterized protein n=1 Tax=Zychaea mexicana TaxID=64656 RepID=UPI0022FEDD0E|nr:uncharacterized protein BDB00DRAFT_791600 [Zychaea mexicana]KAI9488815.1 hypothetical protein BDB00DRAFT_791600 [Zychaea mexicana]